MHYIYLEEISERLVDWRFFIYYNRITGNYILNCARRKTSYFTDYTSYYLRFNTRYELCNYILHLTGSYEKRITRNSRPIFNYSFFNSRIVNPTNFTNFEKLLELNGQYDNQCNELYGFDNKVMTKKYLMNALDILRNISIYQ
jgi:hypothetical protein